MFACGQGVEDVTDVSFHKGPCTGTENAYSSAYSTCSLFADTRHVSQPLPRQTVVCARKQYRG